MKKIKFQGKLAKQWFLDYVIIVAMTIAVIIIPYSINTKVLYKEISISTKYFAKHLVTTCDNVLNEISGAMWNCSNNDQIKKYSSAATQNTDSIMLGHSITKQLANEIGYLKGMESLWIYFGSSDTLITPQGVFDTQTFYKTSVMSTGISYNDFINLITTDSSFMFVPLGDNYLVVDKKFCAKRNGFTNTSFIGVVNKGFIKSSFAEFADEYKMNILMYKKDGTICSVYLSELDSSLIPPHSFDNIPKNGTISIGKKKYTAIDMPSSFDRFKYVILMPDSRLRAKVIPPIVLEIISIIVIMLAGIYLAYIFINRNYAPIKNILTRYPNIANIHANENELNAITDMISSITGNYKDLNEKYNISLRELKSIFLNDLIDGKINSDNEFNEGLEKFEMTAISSKYLVCVINVINTGVLENDETLVTLVLSNIIEEMINSVHLCYVFKTNISYVCLININDKTDEYNIQDIYQKLAEAKKIIDESFELKFSFTMSNVYETYSEIRHAYLEAVYIADYNLLNNTSYVFNNEIENSGFSDANEMFSPDSITVAIKSGDSKRLEDILRKICDSIVNNKSIGFYAKKSMLVNIPVTIYNAVQILESGSTDFVHDFDDAMRTIMSSDDLLVCRSEIYKLSQSACSFLLNATEKTKSLSDKTDAFINKNYNNPNLGVSYIADNIGFHSVYLSTTYKKQTGISIPLKIAQVRMKHAVFLLQTGKYNIKTIAGMVGYPNDRTFTKIFKETYGVTPSQFKS
ncbi:MAG: AraC family transcriptional regulator [Clostridia bacterium]|nr:AraC family transcriptional regulator [Clostridia bacterium]